MTHFSRFWALKFVAALAMSSPFAASAGWTTDGNLQDWGITVADGNTMSNASNAGVGTSYAGISGTVVNQTPTAGLNTVPGSFGGFNFSYVLEDSNDTWNHGYTLAPYQGGQDYDAEFMGMGVFGNQLVIAIVTGQRPDNGPTFYSPGDIQIRTNAGIFGVEVGGGGAGGATFVLNGDGTTQKLDPGPQNALGSIWKNASWIKDGVAHLREVQMQAGTGSYAGSAASFINTGNSITTQHAIIEVAISLSVFGGAKIQGASWAPSCGNDILDITGLNLSTAPEPGSLALMGLGGLISFGARAYRRRRGASVA